MLSTFNLLCISFFLFQWKMIKHLRIVTNLQLYIFCIEHPKQSSILSRYAVHSHRNCDPPPKENSQHLHFSHQTHEQLKVNRDPGRPSKRLGVLCLCPQFFDGSRLKTQTKITAPKLVENERSLEINEIDVSDIWGTIFALQYFKQWSPAKNSCTTRVLI